MKINRIQFQPGMSLNQFLDRRNNVNQLSKDRDGPMVLLVPSATAIVIAIIGVVAE